LEVSGQGKKKFRNSHFDQQRIGSMSSQRLCTEDEGIDTRTEYLDEIAYKAHFRRYVNSLIEVVCKDMKVKWGSGAIEVLDDQVRILAPNWRHKEMKEMKKMMTKKPMRLLTTIKMKKKMSTPGIGKILDKSRHPPISAVQSH